MALVETTLSAACGANDRSIVVASATSVAANRLIEIDGEVMQVTKDYTSGTTVNVIRGLDGTAQKAHPSGARVTHGDAVDFGDPAPGTPTNFPAAGLAFERVSYSASGAIELPRPGSMRLAMLNGTSVLAMTLAVPSKAMDGTILFVVGNGKAAHTLTVSGGIGAAGSSYDVATFDANGQNAVMLIAANEVWVLLSPMTGTLTAVVPALA
jgi:hypothetical protein